MQELFKSSSTISYGKRKNLLSGVVEDYLILADSTKGFTSDEKNAFEKICKSFSWTSTSSPGEILSPCYGFFPFGDDSSILVARFIDDGRDNQGRADLLRVDALKIPSKLFNNAKADFKLFLEAAFWKSIFLVENTAAENTVNSAEDISKIFDLLQNNYDVPLLVGCSKNFKFKLLSGKFNIFDIDSKMVEGSSMTVGNPFISPTNSTVKFPLTSNKVVNNNLKLIFSLVLVIIGLGYFCLSLKSNNFTLTTGNATLTDNLDKAEKAKATLMTDKATLTDKLRIAENATKLDVGEVIKKVGKNDIYTEYEKDVKDYLAEELKTIIKNLVGEIKYDPSKKRNETEPNPKSIKDKM